MKSKGFTLIELLVVVAIIGILATIVLSALGDARSKGRDARRESDIKTIQNALELYYVDNGIYPTTSWRSSNDDSGVGTWETLGDILGVQLPIDPINNTGGHATEGFYTYSYFAHTAPTLCAGQMYMLVYNKENSNGTGPSDGIRSYDGVGRGYGDAFVVGVSPVPL